MSEPQRWEYICIQVLSIQKEGKWTYLPRLFKQDGTHEDLTENTTAIVILNQLGAHGWELVTQGPWTAGVFTGTLDSGNTYLSAEPMSRVYWLKRPIQA